MLRLTYNQFLTRIKTSNITTDFISFRYKSMNETIGLTWIIGGQYSDKDPREIEIEPELEDLDKILENLCPDISILKYKRLIRENLKRDTHKDYGYYGDWTEFGVKFIELKNIFNWLVFENLIEEIKDEIKEENATPTKKSKNTSKSK